MAEQKIYVDYDFNKNQILNAKLHPVSTVERTALGSTLNSNDQGLIVYDKDITIFFVWYGNEFIPIGLTDEQYQNSGAKITESQATSAKFTRGFTTAEIRAKAFSISKFTVDNIDGCRSWKQIKIDNRSIEEKIRDMKLIQNHDSRKKVTDEINRLTLLM